MTDEAKNGGLNKAIVAGIISGIVVIVFIQPILGLIWRFFLSNVKILNDLACFDAALGYTDKYGFLGQEFVFGISMGIATGYLVTTYWTHSPSEGGVGTLATRISRLSKSRMWATLWFVSVVGFGAFSLGRDFLALQLNASFRQRLTVLAPKISEQEYKEFLASWASMRNEEDYQHIVQDMENKAKLKGITLPKLLRGAAPSS